VKKMKWLSATGAVLALGAAGFVTTSSPASGSTPLITAGPGSHVHCTITGTAKLAPALANDWSQAAHSGGNADPGDAGAAPAPIVSKDAATYTGNATIAAAVASIPNTTYTANGGAPTAVTTTAKVATASCTSTLVKDITTPTITDNVVSASIASGSISTGANEATCGGLANTSGTTFQSIIKWKGTTAKITPTTVVSNLAAIADIGNTGVGFDLTADGTGGTSITGSFASATGGSSESKAFIDATTLNAILGASATSATQTTSVCEPLLTGKFTPAAAGASDAIAIKLKKPKGLKAIGVTNSGGQGPIIAPNDTPSSIDAVN